MALKETMSKESAMMAINATSKMSHQKVTILGTMTKSYHFSDNDQKVTILVTMTKPSLLTHLACVTLVN